MKAARQSASVAGLVNEKRLEMTDIHGPAAYGAASAASGRSFTSAGISA